MKQLFLLLLALISVDAYAIGTSYGKRSFAENPRQISGRNYVKNPDAELDASFGITATNTTVSRNTSSPLFGDADFQFSLDSVSDSVRWTMEPFPAGADEGKCFAEVTYKNPTKAGLWRVIGNGDVVLGYTSLEPTSDPKVAQIFYDCPEPLEVTSLEALGQSNTSTTVNADQIKAGRVSDSRLGVLQLGGQVVGTARFTGGSCSGSETSTGSYFNLAGTCSTARTGVITACSGSTLTCTVTVEPGYAYSYELTGATNEGGSANAYYALYDGTTRGAAHLSDTSIGSSHRIPIVLKLEGVSYTSRQSITIAGQVKPSNTNGAGFACSDADGNGCFLTVKRYPLANQVTVNIFETGDYGPTSFTPTFTNLSPTVNTCTHARSGKFMLLNCRFTSTGGGSASELRMTLPGSLTVDNSVAANTIAGAGTYNVAAAANPVVTMSGGNTYVTFGTQASGSAGLTNLNGSNFGSGDGMSFEARVPIKEWSTFPIGVAGVSPFRHFYFSFGGASEATACSSTPCTIYKNYDSDGNTNTVSQVAWASDGQYTATITSGRCSQAPVCTVQQQDSASAYAMPSTNGTASTTTSFYHRWRNAGGTSTNAAAAVNCTCVK
jgi:hypothetical protein